VAAEEDAAREELRMLQEQFAALGVEEFLASAASTVVALAQAKLEAKDLPEAKKAIDALASIAPHVGGELGRELQNALTGLQVAFARAASV
jgi:hypothetical protein